jgi:Major Facilitator Superfamily
MEKDRAWLGLIFASFLSQSGSYFLTLALSAYVYATSGSPTKACLVFVLSTLPAVAVSAKVGDWIDHHLSRSFLIANELLSSLSSLACGLLIYFDLSLIWICLVVGVRSVFLQVERTSLLRWIKEISPAATQPSRFRLFFLAFFLSTMCAGFLTYFLVGTRFSMRIVLWDVASYLGASAIIACLPRLRVATQKRFPSHVLSTLGEILASPQLRPSLLNVCFTQSLFQGASTVLVTLLPLSLFHRDLGGVGPFQIAISLGITGGFVINSVPRLMKSSCLLQFAWVFCTVGILAQLGVTSLPFQPLCLILLCLLNLCYEVVWLSSMAHFLSSAEPQCLGRYQFVANTTAAVLMAASMLLYSALLEQISLTISSRIHAALCTSIFLGAVFYFRARKSDEVCPDATL